MSNHSERMLEIVRSANEDHQKIVDLLKDHKLDELFTFICNVHWNSSKTNLVTW